MQRIIIASLVAALVSFGAASRPAGLAAGPPLLLKGARVVTVTGAILDGADVLIRDGLIERVGPGLPAPANATIVDLAGAMLFPGFIDAHTNLGTADLASFGPDDDEATSPVTPHVRVVDALNAENRYLALARRSGVTTVVSAPGEGNLLAGQSAVVGLDGAAVIKAPAAIEGALGERPKLRYGPKSKLPATRMGEVALLRQTLLDTRNYLDARQADQRKRANGKAEGLPPAVDAKLEALGAVLARELPLVVASDRRDDILSALRVAEEFGLRLVISHGTEAHRVADTLASRQVPVILGPLAERFQRIETLAASDDNAAALDRAGVQIAFQTGSVANVTSLVDAAREAVAHGLPWGAAVKALTVTPAAIFGVADRMGSIEPGKRADLVAFGGDPLRETARVRLVVIGGRLVEKM